MPYANSQGGRIHYQVEGAGPPLVLQHGFASSLEAWRQFGYVQALQSHYQLILLDARGHGASDKPHDPAAYALPSHAGDVVAVLDALKLPKARFCGYSMAGWIGFGMARYARHRLHSLIIGGAPPYRDSRWDAFRQVDGADADAFMAAVEEVIGERILPEMKPFVVANDLQALAVAAKERSSREEVLGTMTTPCLLFVGESDARYPAVREYAPRIPQATFVSLPGPSHVAGFVRSDRVVPHLMHFLATMPH